MTAAGRMKMTWTNFQKDAPKRELYWKRTNDVKPGVFD